MTTIFDKIDNEELVPVEEFLKLDEYEILKFLSQSCDEEFPFYKNLFDYCITNKNTEDSKILCLLGCLYENGLGVEFSTTCEEAVKYYKMAIDKGNVNAMYYLGYMHSQMDTYDFKNDYYEAVRYLKMAIENGHNEAMAHLGWMYEVGEGVIKNIKKAIKYYKMAVENGTIDAMNKLGKMYRSGEGVVKNFKKALR